MLLYMIVYYNMVELDVNEHYIILESYISVLRVK